MKNFRILAGFMVVFLVAFLSLSTAAHAKDDGDSGRKKGKKLPKHARVLRKQIKANTAAIENIELTPGPKGDKGDTGATGATGETGPKGDKGDTGATGATGADGQDGQDGLSIQGPPGQSGIGDMNTVCDGTTTGMIRYNTVNSAFEGCDGTAWVSLSSNPPPVHYAIGDAGPAGGIVFHVTGGGLHGLEAALTDQNVGYDAPWGCEGFDVIGAHRTAVGTGAQNTYDILAGCSDATAASLADAYTYGGFNDWYLPSKDELNLLYQQKGVVGGFIPTFYWSSSESTKHPIYDAWAQGFEDGIQSEGPKHAGIRVRAIRTF